VNSTVANPRLAWTSTIVASYHFLSSRYTASARLPIFASFASFTGRPTTDSGTHTGRISLAAYSPTSSNPTKLTTPTESVDPAAFFQLSTTAGTHVLPPSGTATDTSTTG